MNMSIRDREGQHEDVNERIYEVSFDDDVVLVTVTHNPVAVGRWVTILKDAYPTVAAGRLVVGVRVEWRRSLCNGLVRWLNHRVDILQLCVNEHCLIFQIRHGNRIIPEQLVQILGDNRFVFVGVGIRRDVEILNRDYGIPFGENIVDLSEKFAWLRRNNFRWLPCRNYGLRELNKLVFERDYVRPTKIKFSKWDNLSLDQDQIMHACAGAYVCYKVGQVLIPPDI